MSATLERPPAPVAAISRPPTKRENYTNTVFRALTYLFAWATVLLVLFIVFEIGGAAIPAMRKYGLGFLTGNVWDPNADQYGILPHIWGTLFSSALALVIGTVLGMAVAIFLSERFLSTFIYRILKVFGMQFHPVLGQAARQDGSAAEESGRTAGRDSERGLRAVGNFRHHPADPAGLQLACIRTWADCRFSARR